MPLDPAEELAPLFQQAIEAPVEAQAEAMAGSRLTIGLAMACFVVIAVFITILVPSKDVGVAVHFEASAPFYLTYSLVSFQRLQMSRGLLCPKVKSL